MSRPQQTGTKRKSSSLQFHSETKTEIKIEDEEVIEEPSKVRKRKKDAPRRGYKKACFICRRDHKACNGARPCENCVYAQKESECVDAPPYLYKVKKPRNTKFFLLDEQSFSSSSSSSSAKPAPSTKPIDPTPAAGVGNVADDKPLSTFLMDQVKTLCATVAQLREERNLLCTQLNLMQSVQQAATTTSQEQFSENGSMDRIHDNNVNNTIEEVTFTTTPATTDSTTNEEEANRNMEIIRQRESRRREIRRLARLCEPQAFLPMAVPSASYPFVIVTFRKFFSPNLRLEDSYDCRYSLANPEFSRLFHLSMEELALLDPRKSGLSDDAAHAAELESKLGPYFSGSFKDTASPVVYSKGQYCNKYGVSFNAYLTAQLFLNDGWPSFLVVCFTDTDAGKSARKRLADAGHATQQTDKKSSSHFSVIEEEEEKEETARTPIENNSEHHHQQQQQHTQSFYADGQSVASECDDNDNSGVSGAQQVSTPDFVASMLEEHELLSLFFVPNGEDI